jgi:hypothetical protein
VNILVFKEIVIEDLLINCTENCIINYDSKKLKVNKLRLNSTNLEINALDMKVGSLEITAESGNQ